MCFCLGITEVDPMLVDLLFERFVSTERDELPALGAPARFMVVMSAIGRGMTVPIMSLYFPVRSVRKIKMGVLLDLARA